MNSRPDRLLIVDDNELNRDMLARRLAKKGYTVSVAENACQLEDRIRQERLPALVNGPPSLGCRVASRQRSAHRLLIHLRA